MPARLFLKGFFVSLCVLIGASTFQVMAVGSEMYVCTGQDGVRVYQNSNTGENCKSLNLNPITVFPGPPKNTSGPKASDNYGGSGNYSNPSAKESFAFDGKDDRLKILQEELRIEEGKLKSLNDEYKDGQPDRMGNERNYQKYLDRTAALKEDINRATENIIILKNEISRLQR